jgi:hypothetical protein
MKNKHSKFKNTGILFELLVRQIASDTLSGVQCKATTILSEFFKKNSELSKEYYLYNTLLQTKYEGNQDKAVHLIETVISQRKSLNNNELRKQKYNLVKKINECYKINEFVKAKINNYKELASIYQLFESCIGNVPATEIVDSRFTLIEHITNNKKNKSSVETIKENTTKEFDSLDRDMQLFSYKKMLEIFNKKYQNLNNEQKNLLREYINNISDNVKLKEFICKEIPKIKKQVVEVAKTIDDKVIKIKLKETLNQLNLIKESKTQIKDSTVVALLKFYQLIDELKNISK